MGFRSLISLLPAIYATGGLAFPLVGLSPTERASLRWTHDHLRLAQRRTRCYIGIFCRGLLLKKTGEVSRDLEGV